MTKLGIFAAAAAMALLAPAAQAREPIPAFTPAPNSSFLVDLDTPDDHIALWEADDLTGLTALRAKMTVRNVVAKGVRNPTFVVQLENDKGDVTFMVFTKPGKSLMVPLGTVHQGDANLDQGANSVFVSTFEVGETVDLAIDWTADGKVAIVLKDKAAAKIGQGWERHEYQLPGGAPTRIKIMAISGEVEFKDLKLGRSGG